MRVLVCGGRDFNDHERVYAVLDFIAREAEDALDPVDTIIHGEASGADHLASCWGTARKLNVEGYRADWLHLGAAAGPKRNAQMLTEGKPDLVIAFPGGRGTADMVRRAKAAGIPTKEMAAKALGQSECADGGDRG